MNMYHDLLLSLSWGWRSWGSYWIMHSTLMLLWPGSLHSSWILNWSLSRYNGHWRGFATSVMRLLAASVMLLLYNDMLLHYNYILLLHNIILLVLIMLSVILVIGILRNVYRLLLIVHWIHVLIWIWLYWFKNLLNLLILIVCILSNILWLYLIVYRVLILGLPTAIVYLFTVHFILFCFCKLLYINKI